MSASPFFNPKSNGPFWSLDSQITKTKPEPETQTPPQPHVKLWPSGPPLHISPLLGSSTFLQSLGSIEGRQSPSAEIYADATGSISQTLLVGTPEVYVVSDDVRAVWSATRGLLKMRLTEDNKVKEGDKEGSKKWLSDGFSSGLSRTTMEAIHALGEEAQKREHGGKE